MRSALVLALACFCAGALPTSASAQTDPPTVWPDEGPATWTPRPTEPTITADDLRTHVYQLAADSMRGRQAASMGDRMATDYVASVFERLGLEPAGEEGYFQELDFGALAFEPDSIRLAVEGRELEPGVEWAPFAPNASVGISGSASAEGVATVYGGYWNAGATSLAPDAMRGRVVVFVVPDAETIQRLELSMSLRLRGTAVDSAGAAAVLVALSGPLPQGALDGGFGLLTEVTGTPVARVTAAVAEDLFGRPPGELEAGAIGATLDLSWRITYRPPEYPARNVVAVLPGSDPELRGQYVLVGAHNDHEGRLAAPLDHDSLRAYNRVMRPQGANDRPGAPSAEQQARIDSLIAYARSVRPPRPDSVMNGADDDASGTAVLLEIAERFASGEPPARSIVFISHAAEEAGLLGSSWFTDHPTVPLDSIVAAHNMDMVGKGRVSDVKFGGHAQVQVLGSRRLSADFGDVIDSLNAVREETMAIDYSWDRTNALNRFCRSDQVSYFRHEIPVTYFSTGYSSDYHQPTDEPQYIDFEHSARVGRFVYDIMRAVADRPERLRVLLMEERDLSAQCT